MLQPAKRPQKKTKSISPDNYRVAIKNYSNNSFLLLKAREANRIQHKMLR